MAFDALLQATGAVAGSPRETVTADGTAAGGYRYIGPNQSVMAVFSIGGAFLTSGSLGGTIKIASDASGTGAVTVATFTAKTKNDRGLDSADTQDALGDVNAPGAVNFNTTSALPYAAFIEDVTGSTSAAGTVCDFIPTINPVLRSGQ